LFSNKIKGRLLEIILLGAVGFLQFFRLGIGEIQSWDESLYLIRAEAIQKFGCWIDQTHYAIGGLYSSTHPPLVIWMMTLMRMTFGSSNFVSRSIAALSAVIALYFFYKLASRFFSRWTVLFGSISLGVAQNFIWYGHHAQLDIPMFAFITAAVYYAVRAFEESNSKFAIISGFLFGCALLTKAIQGLYLLPFLLALPYVFKPQKWFKELAIFLATACIIAIPWYIYMTVRHSDFTTDYGSLVGSMKSGTYSNVEYSSWWYYINQSIINFPLLVLGFLSLLTLIPKWKKMGSRYDRFSFVSALWFISMLIFISAFKARMLHFSLFLLLPTSLLVCSFVEEFLISVRKNYKTIGSILLLGSLAWSGSELVRKAIRENSISSLNPDYLFIVYLLILVVASSFVFYKYKARFFNNVILFTASLLLISIDYYRLGSRKEETYIDGAKESAKILISNPSIRSLTVYHNNVPHESFMPQLNYYTDGWLLGWNSSRYGKMKTLDEIDSLISIESIPMTDAAIVYLPWDAFYTPSQDEKERILRINQVLSKHYTNSFHSKKYQLYWGAVSSQ
jgi:4-amino-4-deoxy-L-arabinose transferase-like glycosyltransferase